MSFSYCAFIAWMDDVQSALKGPDSIAQGTALGIGVAENTLALKGRHSLPGARSLALSGLGCVRIRFSQGGALGCRIAAPFGAEGLSPLALLLRALVRRPFDETLGVGLQHGVPVQKAH